MKKQAGDPEIDVNRAFALAAELEGSEVNAIYSRLTTPLHASMYLLKRKIVSSPADHVNQLAVAGKKFGVSAGVLKKLERLRDSSPK